VQLQHVIDRLDDDRFSRSIVHDEVKRRHFAARRRPPARA
jgi:hypothetical protein